MNDTMLDKYAMEMVSREKNVEKTTITSVIAPSGVKKRDDLIEFVRQSEQNKYQEFNKDIKQFISSFECDNKGQWVERAMDEMENKLKKFENILL
ncbi:hypothetical protein [Macrococcoides canis]|uniref:hypothetical protein n=1 Tax=Macrococcoides canis TaxID=1855823 RepID=UPI0020B7CC09|nr:hypothetical protein [Macrococcus canis]UTG99584.1 hypothetical protein KFV04_08750 [Macrococcus canis]